MFDEILVKCVHVHRDRVHSQRQSVDDDVTATDLDGLESMLRLLRAEALQEVVEHLQRRAAAVLGAVTTAGAAVQQRLEARQQPLLLRHALWQHSLSNI